MIPNAFRTLHCNAVRTEHIGQTVTLCGWVNSARDHGGVIFIDLRDREGLTQVVFRPEENAELAAQSHNLRDEDVLQITGKVAERLKGTENAKLPTGDVEIVATECKVLNKADVLPFHLDRELSNEDLRMKYRYLDLRRERMNKNIRTRHKITNSARNYLDAAGFVEVETPILSNPTPEGARDFLVPARLNPGKFYALPQAPQQYKQLMMVAGLERYFQIARCFRDEDLRGDRQPEFTQLDIEMSFVDEASVRAYVEAMVIEVTKRIRPDRPIQQLPLPTFTYEEAMERYGSDKPDIRFAMELIDLGAALPESTGFKVFDETRSSGGRIRAIRVAGRGGITRSDVDDLTERAKRYGANGLVWIALQPDGEVRSPIAKFLSPEATAALWSATGGKETHADGDLLLIVAGPKILSAEVLGRLRVEVALELGLADPDVLAFCWVHRFPMYQWEAESGRWDATHNPFSAPVPEHLNLLATTSGDLAKRSEGDPAAGALAQQYDIVLNGWELGGGSIRIHDRALLERSFALMGHSLEDARAKFGALLDAFEYGAPPHGGIAIGVERWAALLAGQINIREVMAFPKTQSGSDLMLEAPSEPDAKQWAELGLSVRPVKS